MTIKLMPAKRITKKAMEGFKSQTWVGEYTKTNCRAYLPLPCGGCLALRVSSPIKPIGNIKTESMAEMIRISSFGNECTDGLLILAKGKEAEALWDKPRAQKKLLEEYKETYLREIPDYVWYWSE